MKKIILYIVFIVFWANTVAAQNMLNIYKSGPIKLVPVEEYGASNNWDELFDLYYQTEGFSATQREEFKKIVVAPDGSVFMSHKNRYEIWKFGPVGNFIKSFGSKGGKYSQFQYYPSIQPVVNGTYVFTSDSNGRLKFFDLEGNYVKSINLDFMPQSFQIIGGDKIRLSGSAIWSQSFRYFVADLDFTSEEDKIIYDFFIDDDYETIDENNIDSLINSQKRHLQLLEVPDRDELVLLPGGGFIRTNRTSGKLTSLDRAGKIIVDTKLDIQRLRISEEDVSENYEKIKRELVVEREAILISKNSDQAQKVIVTINQMLSSIEAYKDIDNYEPYLPYYSNIIVDDEGNMLVFEFTESDAKYDNIFDVVAYNSNWETVARTSFISDEYELNISANTFVISGGYLYAVAKLKNYDGMPLRLVKFRMVPANE